MSLDTRYGRVIEPGPGDSREHLASAGVSLRVMASKWWLLYQIGFEYQLGGVRPGGFLYEVSFFPAGMGILLGHHAWVGLVAGVGVGGITERLPFSIRAPVECALELDLHRRVRVAGFARAIWVTNDARAGGSASLSFADEAAFGLSLRWGKRYRPDRALSGGNGYFLGILYQEQLESAIVGATFGYSLNGSIF